MIARNTRRLLPALLAGLGLAAAGCGNDDDATGRKPDDVRPVEPSWEGLDVARRDGTSNFGEALRVVHGTFGAERVPGVVLAGRELLALDAEGTPLWRTAWSESDRIIGGALVLDLLPFGTPAGVDDLLLLDDTGMAWRIDGTDGTVLWSRKIANEILEGPAVFGDPADPLFVVSATTAAYRLSDGSRAWNFPLQAPVVYAHGARDEAGAPVLLASVPSDTDTRGDVFVLSPAGEIRLSHQVDTFVTALVPADLDGTGVDTMLIGEPGPRLQAVELDGTVRWSRTFDVGRSSENTYVRFVLVTDLDGDDRPEVVVGIREVFRPETTRVVALDADGEELWRWDAGTDVNDLQRHGPAVLALVGEPHPTIPGTVVALAADPAAATREQWRAQLPVYVSSFASAAGKVVTGSLDGVVRSLDVATGAPAWSRYAGFYNMPALAEIGERLFVGDEAGNLVARGATGEVEWVRRMAGDDFGYVAAATTVTVAGSPHVVSLLAADLGFVHLVRPDGEEVLSIPTTWSPLDMAVVDLDGDGEPEVVVGGIGHGFRCFVAAWSLLSGEQLWQTETPRCRYMSLGAEAGPDAAVAYSAWSQNFEPFVGVLEADGAERWREVLLDTPLWVQLADGAVFVGGQGQEARGFVNRWDAASGALEWTAALQPAPHPEEPNQRVPGYTWFGTVLPAVGGDGRADLVVTTQANHVIRLDASTGDEVWAQPIGDPALTLSSNHYGGAVAFVPGSEAVPPFLFVGQGAWDSRHSASMALRLDGTIVRTWSNRGLVRGAVAGRDADGNPRVTVANSLNISTYRVESAD